MLKDKHALGMNPLYEGSASPRDLYLTTHNKVTFFKFIIYRAVILPFDRALTALLNETRRSDVKDIEMGKR
jgi:hypothetical protein